MNNSMSESIQQCIRLKRKRGTQIFGELALSFWDSVPWTPRSWAAKKASGGCIAEVQALKGTSMLGRNGDAARS